MEIDIVKPSILYMKDVVSGEQGVFDGFPRQYINWANQFLGIDKVYVLDELMSIKSVWVLYEACNMYLNKNKENE